MNGKYFYSGHSRPGKFLNPPKSELQDISYTYFKVCGGQRIVFSVKTNTGHLNAFPPPHMPSVLLCKINFGHWDIKLKHVEENLS